MITIEDAGSEISQQLIDELNTELVALYDAADEIVNSFTPADTNQPRAAFLIIWQGGGAVGCGALRPTHDPATAEIKRMYVRPTARGHGHSRRLLKRLEELAAAYGYTRLILETGVQQPAAIRLYETAGFVPMKCYGYYADDPESRCYSKMLSGIGSSM